MVAPLPEDTLHEAVALYREVDGNAAEAARRLGIARDTFNNRLKQAAKRGLLGTKSVLPGFQISKTTTVTNEDGDVVREFVQQRPEPDGPFNMPDGHRVKGVSALLDAQGRVQAQWIKTREDQFSPERLAELMREAFDGYTPPETAPTPINVDEDTVTIYPLVDFHVGLLAWEEETGENYDINIAEKTILSAMGRLIAASPASNHAVILGLGDLLHFDGYEPVTARSRNPLDTDSRYPKVLRTATRIVLAIIDMALRKHETVTVRMLAGNHDDQSAMAVSLALALRFEGHHRVHVEDSASRFWWYRFGKVFLGATHGDRAKMRDMPLIMAADRPQDWGLSTYRRIYTGHLHHERKIEEGGVIVTCMRSPVVKDAYHSFERYRAGRSVYSETFRADGSEAATLQFNL